MSPTLRAGIVAALAVCALFFCGIVLIVATSDPRTATFQRQHRKEDVRIRHRRLTVTYRGSKADTWLGVLKDRDAEMRVSAANALVEIGAESVPGLVDVLLDGDAELRGTAASCLGKIGPPAKDALPALRRALADEDRITRVNAEWAVRQIDGK